MWDLPRPGLEPVSPALAGGFLTTVPAGKTGRSVLMHYRMVFKNVTFYWKCILCFCFLAEPCNKRDTIMSSQSDGGVEDIASRGDPQRGRRLLHKLEV